MRITCPHCAHVFQASDDEHYQMLSCQRCGKRIQALTEDTLKVSREFLKEVLRERPPES